MYGLTTDYYSEKGQQRIRDCYENTFGKTRHQRVFATKEYKKIYRCKVFKIFFKSSFEHPMFENKVAVYQ
jgi:hypothetical protein